MSLNWFKIQFQPLISPEESVVWVGLTGLAWCECEHMQRERQNISGDVLRIKILDSYNWIKGQPAFNLSISFGQKSQNADLITGRYCNSRMIGCKKNCRPLALGR